MFPKYSTYTQTHYSISIFLFILIKQIILTIIARISANTTDNQISLIPKIDGIIKIMITWKTKVLKNDIKVETNPSLRALKNEEA